VKYDFTYYEDARRFEVITVPYQDFAGFNSSLELLFELGLERVERHVEGLVDDVVAWAADRGDVRLVTPAERQRRAGVVAVAPADPPAASDATPLDETLFVPLPGAALLRSAGPGVGRTTGARVGGGSGVGVGWPLPATAPR
jgi:hypothetical protein